MMPALSEVSPVEPAVGIHVAHDFHMAYYRQVTELEQSYATQYPTLGYTLSGKHPPVSPFGGSLGLCVVAVKPPFLAVAVSAAHPPPHRSINPGV